MLKEAGVAQIVWALQAQRTIQPMDDGGDGGYDDDDADSDEKGKE